MQSFAVAVVITKPEPVVVAVVIAVALAELESLAEVRGRIAALSRGGTARFFFSSRLKIQFTRLIFMAFLMLLFYNN